MNEREQDILYEIRNMYVSGSGIILPRERLGVVVGYMVELEMRIRDLTTERDGAVAEYQSQLEAFRDEANERQRRLAEERDAARAACEDTADVIGWYLGDGDGLAALVEKYGSIREVRQAMEGKAAAIRAALGIESEASE